MKTHSVLLTLLYAHKYLNRFFTETATSLKMSDKLRNKYTVNNHHLGKFQSHRMFPITWWHNQMCVLMALMPLEKWGLLLTLVSYKAPQILYNSRYIQSHKKRLLPTSCSSSHSAVHLCICIGSAPTVQISAKFNTGDFDENLSRKSQLG